MQIRGNSRPLSYPLQEDTIRKASNSATRRLALVATQSRAARWCVVLRRATSFPANLCLSPLRSTQLQQPVGAYGQPAGAYGQPMSAYGQPVQYVQAQPAYYPGGQFAYSQNGAATYAYANPPPMHMSQYPAGFAGGVQYIQQTPTGYGQVQPQAVMLTGGTQMAMPVQTMPGQPMQYVQYY